MQPLISVIIPIYDVEDYLNRCVDSVLAQTYQNLEIILVDDGSPDNCCKICDDYAEKDSRVIVIHKENGGLSSARNKGIDVASGEYITFVDSDDCINRYMIEHLYSVLKITKVDMSICLLEDFFDNNTPNCANCSADLEYKLYSRDDSIFFFDSKNRVNAISACGKLMKKELFKDIRFPINRLCEDAATMYKVFFASKNVVVLWQDLYFYMHRQGSITRRRIPTTEASLLAFDEFIEFCTKKVKDEILKSKYIDIIVTLKANTILENYYFSVVRKADKSFAEKHKKMYYDLLPELKERGLRKIPYRIFEVSPKLFVLAVKVYYKLIHRDAS